ncbi:hypothetical protein ANN_25916 [Periplaneta americana]|uniref:Rab3GAP regulatory subunit C-terminal domain-containing protein n=1 Tax=Periplaneta americana TaxID=6978 RepID=A0ABQ8S4U6_PERAM|nr:hypothetical protein ANN_25916 [Periplaneta americana]
MAGLCEGGSEPPGSLKASSVSQLVAQWLSSTGIDPHRLVDLSDVEFDSVEQQEQPGEESRFRKTTSLDIKEGSKLEVEQGSEVTPANEHETEILSNLSTLKRHFPYSLSSSILLANLCWEFMLTWHRNVDELNALRAAIKCLQVIPSPHLKEGLCSLIWSMHLRQKFESAARLFQKVGKVPKERLCRQDIGISDLEMPLFLDTCMVFLDTFMEASLMSVAHTPMDISRYEELWNCGVSGPPPLVELAMAQPAVNYELLHLHYQLAMALHMLAFFSMRFPKPISSLFDNVGQAALFADLTSQPQLPSHNPDPTLVIYRTQFLSRVISGAIQMIQLVEWDENSQDDKVTRLDARLAVQWISKCYNLASVWQVSSDSLRRYQICELYSNGFDRLAEEVSVSTSRVVCPLILRKLLLIDYDYFEFQVMPAVQDPSLVASQLLLIVGQRLRQIVINSPDMRSKMSHLSPSLSTWLDSLNEENLKSNGSPDLTDLAQLLALTLQHLPEDHQEYHLALQMVETVQAFISASKNKPVT